VHRKGYFNTEDTEDTEKGKSRTQSSQRSTEITEINRMIAIKTLDIGHSCSVFQRLALCSL